MCFNIIRKTKLFEFKQIFLIVHLDITFKTKQNNIKLKKRISIGIFTVIVYNNPRGKTYRKN